MPSRRRLSPRYMTNEDEPRIGLRGEHRVRQPGGASCSMYSTRVRRRAVAGGAADLAAGLRGDDDPHLRRCRPRPSPPSRRRARACWPPARAASRSYGSAGAGACPCRPRGSGPSARPSGTAPELPVVPGHHTGGNEAEPHSLAGLGGDHLAQLRPEVARVAARTGPGPAPPPSPGRAPAPRRTRMSRRAAPGTPLPPRARASRAGRAPGSSPSAISRTSSRIGPCLRDEPERHHVRETGGAHGRALHHHLLLEERGELGVRHLNLFASGGQGIRAAQYPEGAPPGDPAALLGPESGITPRILRVFDLKGRGSMRSRKTRVGRATGVLALTFLLGQSPPVPLSRRQAGPRHCGQGPGQGRVTPITSGHQAHRRGAGHRACHRPCARPPAGAAATWTSGSSTPRASASWPAQPPWAATSWPRAS